MSRVAQLHPVFIAITGAYVATGRLVVTLTLLDAAGMDALRKGPALGADADGALHL
jgi:hypothetical protein